MKAKTGVRQWVYDRSLVADLARVFQSFRYRRCTFERDRAIVDALLAEIADEIEEHDPTFRRDVFLSTAHYFRSRRMVDDCHDDVDDS